MRLSTLTCLLVVSGFTSNAQLTVQPQFGIENTRTSINYNNLGSFSPLGGQLSVQPGVRADYKFKQGFGAFLGITTNRSAVSFTFSDPETAINTFKASPAKMQLRFEGGYQFNSKPIYFNRSAAAKSTAKPAVTRDNFRGHCGHYCPGSRYGKGLNKTASQAAKAKGWYVSIQPAVGIAFIPSTLTNVNIKMQGSQASYEYNAGNWNYALIAGSGFEFGQGTQRKITVSVNYLKGLGNMGSRTINTISSGKSTITNLQSATAGWNLRVGIPFSLHKQQPVHRGRSFMKVPPRREGRCGQYRPRCIRTI